MRTAVPLGRVLLPLVIGCAASAALPSPSAGVVLDFESLYAMNYLSGYPIPLVVPGSPESPAVTDFVSVRVDLWADSGMELILNAYGLNGALLDSDQAFDAPGIFLTVAAPGIHRVEFLGSHDWCGVALDDLTFDPVEEPTPIDTQTWGRLKARYR